MSNERFGIEQDPNISITITEDSDAFCFRLEFKHRVARTVITLHARSIADLIHKATIALLDWQAQVSTKKIEQILKK